MDVKKATEIFVERLGDDSLILSHRITEWCGHGPELEEDIALSNIGLDLLGQCQSLLNYAGELEGEGRKADDYAYKRPERSFKNVLLVEQPNGHYGDTIARQFLYSVFQFYLMEGMASSKDEFLKGFAEKSIKEVAYHVRHTSQWVIRFGDGTQESHEKIQEALALLWRYTAELFDRDEVIITLEEADVIPSIDEVKRKWSQKIDEILEEATLERPKEEFFASGGRKGIHSEHLGYMLTDMQYMQRTYPNATWD